MVSKQLYLSIYYATTYIKTIAYRILLNKSKLL